MTELKTKEYGTGVVVAIITPLTEDGQIDEQPLRGIISNCISHRVNGIFVLGTTGEGTCLTQREREKVIRVAKGLTGENVPLYVGVMDTSTNRVKENIECAEANGADIVVVTPTYNLSSKAQDEVVRHMGASAKFASVPVMAYNIPQTTNVNIALESVERLMELENVIGLKDSSGDWEQFQKEIFLKEIKGKTFFKLLMGAEDLAGIALLMGADGCVSGVANFAPGLVVEVYEAAREGNLSKVKNLQFKVSRLREVALIGGFWLAGFKYACSLLGFCQEFLSPPLPRLLDSQKKKVKEILIREGFEI